MSFNNLAFTSIVDLQLTSCLWFRGKSSLTRAIAQPIISLLICSKFHISLLLAGLDKSVIESVMSVYVLKQPLTFRHDSVYLSVIHPKW